MRAVDWRWMLRSSGRNPMPAGSREGKDAAASRADGKAAGGATSREIRCQHPQPGRRAAMGGKVSQNLIWSRACGDALRVWRNCHGVDVRARDLPNMTKEEVKAKMDERRRQDRMASARMMRAMRAGRHADGAVLLRAKNSQSQLTFVSPNIGGGWRITHFGLGQPTGHEVLERFTDAVASLCGRHGRWGPPHGRADEWEVLGEDERF